MDDDSDAEVERDAEAETVKVHEAVVDIVDDVDQVSVTVGVRESDRDHVEVRVKLSDGE
jgi:hypothetical protein